MGSSRAMVPNDKLEQILAHFEFLEARMNAGLSGDEIARVAREYSEMKPVVEQIQTFKTMQSDLIAAQEMLADQEMAELAQEEIDDLQVSVRAVQEALMIALLPKDAADARPAILEIRAGTGGDEAALFAADLLRMYIRYADEQGWKVSVISENSNEIGGYKEVVANIQGSGVFARLKYESGVHRVQRVPATESGGRIHTSAATVAVLPEAEDVDIDIQPNDIRIDTMRASGAGGQHVNTTDSAVRITHIPTGIMVVSAEKSQHRNRELAMQVLRTRLYDLERQKTADARAADRKEQVGSGDRSERIRTYNFPQGRVTDHRINLTLYKLDQVLQGGIDEFVDALTANEQAQKLADLNNA
jgi:peptide chain release factor 1